MLPSRQLHHITPLQVSFKYRNKMLNSNSGFILADGGHVCEDAKQEVSLQARVEGRGYDDVPALRQVDAYEHRPGVDVGASTNLLLGGVHPVDPVKLHLNTETAAVCTHFLHFVSIFTEDMTIKHAGLSLTLCMSKPIARFSPRPSLSVARRSFCCRQIRTSSSGFFTSNTYYTHTETRNSHILYTHTSHIVSTENF